MNWSPFGARVRLRPATSQAASTQCVGSRSAHGDALFGVNRQLHTVGPERRACEADRHDRPG